MDRYTLIGVVVALIILVVSLLLAFGAGSVGPAAVLARLVGAGLTGFVVVLLLRNFGPD